jgi:hypothetical protein
VATIFILLGAGCAALISSLNNLDVGRKHLKPIPVSRSVCPYVQLMHVAANGFQAVSPAQDLAPYADSTPAQWPKLRAEIAHRLDVLDHAVEIGQRAEFPRPIEERLSTVDEEVRAGEVQLVRADGAVDLWVRTGVLLSNGQVAFGEASDLVGSACDVQLAADLPPARG